MSGEKEVTVGEIIRALEILAPESTAEQWDNVGLLIGDDNQVVDSVLTALDITDDVVEEAITAGCGLIVVHHPLIFRGMKKITQGDAIGRRVMRLIRGGTSVYAAHTNLDIARGGTNDTVFDLLRLNTREDIVADGSAIGRAGLLKSSMTLEEMSHWIGCVLGLPSIRYVGGDNVVVNKVGVCTGSGMDYCAEAKAAGCDVYITGDITYHRAQEALDMGLCLIDGMHFATEAIVAEILASYLRVVAGENGWRLNLRASESQKDVFTIVDIRGGNL